MCGKAAALEEVSSRLRAPVSSGQGRRQRRGWDRGLAGLGMGIGGGLA